MLGRSLALEAAFWAACLLLAAAFVVLAVAAANHYELAIDEKVTFAVQGLYTHEWADGLFDAANRLGDVPELVLAASALVLALLARRRVNEAIVVSAAMISPLLLAATDASIERPDDIYNAMRGTFDGLQYPRIYPSPNGFPSGSTFGVVLVYGMIFWLALRIVRSWLAIAAVRLACAVVIIACCLAPMYAGYHWFTDCLGGAILGMLVLLLSWRVLRALQREREPMRVNDLQSRDRAPVRPSPS